MEPHKAFLRVWRALLLFSCATVLLLVVFYNSTRLGLNGKGSQKLQKREENFSGKKRVSVAHLFTSHTTNVSHLTLVEESDYFQPRKQVVTDSKFPLILQGSRVCEELGRPFLLFLILSTWPARQQRDAIRSTWASGKFPVVGQSDASSHTWRREFRHVFLFGVSQHLEERRKALSSLRAEDDQWHDIVVADFVDSYFNLTYKVLVGFAWATRYCPGAHHVVKMDHDVFVHVPRLRARLGLPEWGRAIVGYFAPKDPVERKGKYAVSKEVYSLPFYPPHVKGPIYAMPLSVAQQILQVSFYMPYVNMEDAHITGILARVVQASHKPFLISDYDAFPEKSQDTCVFSRRPTLLAAQHIKPATAHDIWRSVFDRTQCDTRH